jgi:hypothetical protein
LAFGRAVDGALPECASELRRRFRGHVYRTVVIAASFTLLVLAVAVD